MLLPPSVSMTGHASTHIVHSLQYGFYKQNISLNYEQDFFIFKKMSIGVL